MKEEPSHNVEHLVSTRFVRSTIGYGLAASPSSRDSYWRKQRRRAARILADAGLDDAAVVRGLRAFASRGNVVDVRGIEPGRTRAGDGRDRPAGDPHPLGPFSAHFFSRGSCAAQ